MKQISALLLVIVLLFPPVLLNADELQMGFAQTECKEEPAIFSPTDDDGDGISNTLEVNGIDINDDGEPEINFTALGGKPDHKDIYLKIDYMKNHKPSEEALDKVTLAFANAEVCNPSGKSGINLHVRVDNELPHSNITHVVCSNPPDWSGFEDLESKSLNITINRLGADAFDILEAENQIYYHAIFVHQIKEIGTFLDGGRLIVGGISGSYMSGCADPPNRHLVVSLGPFRKALDIDPATGDVRSNSEYEAGTLLHELGHTLGLQHGGGDADLYKPNYVSVMNYNFQFPDHVGNRPLDYSRCEMASLDESGLNESVGTGPSCPTGLDTYVGYKEGNNICDPNKMYPSGSTLDWNLNNVNETQWKSTHDINCDKNYTMLSSYDDWANIQYLLNGSTWETFTSSLGGAPSLAGAQERLPDGFIGELTVESVIDARFSLLSQINDTSANIESPPHRDYYDGSIGLSNYTTATEIFIPNNASGSLIVTNASGSFSVQNVTGVTVPTNSSTTLIVNNASGSFAVQTGANDTNLGNVTEAPLPVNSNTSNSTNIIVDNATDATISNGTGVIATNATGSFLFENATNIIIPSNDTNGATAQNGTSLSDLIVKSNNITEAITKIDELSQATDSFSGSSDSSLGGVSSGDSVINSTIQSGLTSQLENLKLVLEKQLGS